jgi:hypothetical protein
MKFALFSLLSLMLLFGCKHGVEVPNAPATKHLYLPKWTFLAKASATFDKEQAQVPQTAYVFPALRLNSQGQPIDQLAYRVLDDESLDWYSAAPLGAELKTIVEKKLTKLGFRSISFKELTDSSADHSVLVFNLYYAEARGSQDNPKADPDESWTTFTRITAATFPKDLNAAGKRDLMNHELVTLFNGKEWGVDVIKCSQAYLLNYIGKNRQWSESINLLN